MTKIPAPGVPRIAVFGGRVSSGDLLEEAVALGRMIAERGGIVYCGGMGGVMESVAKGASQAGGEVVGILPSADVTDGNPYVTVPVVTGIGTARNSIIARSVDAAVAIDGRYGTLSEIAYSLDCNIPVFGIDTWEIKGVTPVRNAVEAIDKIWSMFQWEM